ncbi:hypothetical protein, partial [Cellulomonas iranensis]|uniref:hypothetical protein n=1 Tax=Cellulomonas iranensis TaxID=76862 RepID=UPI001C4F7972
IGNGCRGGTEQALQFVCAERVDRKKKCKKQCRYRNHTAYACDRIDNARNESGHGQEERKCIEKFKHGGGPAKVDAT